MAKDTSYHRLVAALAALPLLLGADPMLGTTPSGHLAQAVAAQRALVAEQPDSAAALNDLGNLLVEARELEQAEEAYRQAMAVDPGRPEPPFNLALLLAAQRHKREARKLLKAMLEEHPNHAWGHYQLGTLQQAAGKRNQALRSYREAFRLDPTLSDPRRNPHVLDNSLTTAAMLEAFALLAPASTSRRIYVEPSRITGLLLPSLTAAPAEPMEEVAPDESMAGEPIPEEPGEPIPEEPIPEEAAAPPTDAGGSP